MGSPKKSVPSKKIAATRHGLAGATGEAARPRPLSPRRHRRPGSARRVAVVAGHARPRDPGRRRVGNRRARAHPRRARGPEKEDGGHGCAAAVAQGTRCPLALRPGARAAQGLEARRRAVRLRRTPRPVHTAALPGDPPRPPAWAARDDDARQPHPAVPRPQQIRKRAGLRAPRRLGRPRVFGTLRVWREFAPFQNGGSVLAPRDGVSRSRRRRSVARSARARTRTRTSFSFPCPVLVLVLVRSCHSRPTSRPPRKTRAPAHLPTGRARTSPACGRRGCGSCARAGSGAARSPPSAAG